MENIEFDNGAESVLDLTDAQPSFFESGLAGSAYNLTLDAGECVLIECRDPVIGSRFVDFCTGLIGLETGSVEFLGLSWGDLDGVRADSLRGMIGRVSPVAGWIDELGMDLNILWPQLYHTDIPDAVLIKQAMHYVLRFGLPGLPVLPPYRLSDIERRRCQCVRAFLGQPRLLVFQDPVRTDSKRFRTAFTEALCTSLGNGAAAMWLSADATIWDALELDNFQRYRLDDDGLTLIKGVE